MLEKTEWKYDIRPEFMDGKNIADYVDADILAKLDQLEHEEEEMDQIVANTQGMEELEDEMDNEYDLALKEVKGKRSILKLAHKMNRHKTAYPRNNMNIDEVVEGMKDAEIDTDRIETRVREVQEKGQEKARKNRLEREMHKMDLESGEEEDEEELDNEGKMKKKVRSISRSRSRGYVREVSVHDQKLETIRKKSQGLQFKKIVNVNESDRLIQSKMPKHLYTGKATFKRDRR